MPISKKCRKNVKCNVSDGEIKALQQLIQLQKEREIVIKMCDKGAGIIILDFSEYIKSCNEHLNSESEENEKYYTRVNATLLQEAYDEILLLLQEGTWIYSHCGIYTDTHKWCSCSRRCL